MADFLEKVKQGIDKGVNVVSVRSKEALEAGKLKSRIGALADMRKEALEELGSLVYATFQADQGVPEGKAKAKCQEIAKIDKEIADKEAALQAVHREAKKELGIPLCAGCGEELGEDDVFCRKCGRKAEA